MTIDTLQNSEVELKNEAAYEAPRIESVLAAEELEREVAYAGIIVPSNAA